MGSSVFLFVVPISTPPFNTWPSRLPATVGLPFVTLEKTTADAAQQNFVNFPTHFPRRMRGRTTPQDTNARVCHTPQLGAISCQRVRPINSSQHNGGMVPVSRDRCLPTQRNVRGRSSDSRRIRGEVKAHLTSNRPRHVTCHIQQLPQVGVESTTWRQALLGVVCTAVLWKPRTGMRIARMCQIVQRDYTRFLLASSPCPSEHWPHMFLQWITGWLRPWHDRNHMGELCLPTPAESKLLHRDLNN